MILQLCVVNDGDNVINKTLTNILEIDIRLKKDFDIESPAIYLSGETSLTYLDFNYCVIPDLNRNYFIDSYEQINSKVVKLNCVCDVLETYKNDIMGSNARYKRNLKTGDYNDVSLDKTTESIIIKHLSNVDITGQSSMIMSTIGEL